MQLFNEYLRELIQRNHMKVAALSRLTGIERTLLSKVLTGQRVLPYHALDELVLYLKLTPEEEKLLRHYYEAQFEKEGVRRSRELVKKLFENMASLDFSMAAFEETRMLISLEEYVGERCVITGETNVQFLLRMVLTEEIAHPDARVEMTIPPENVFLMEELSRRYLENKTTMDVSHVLMFDAAAGEKDINLHNLEYFCRIFPVCLLSKQHYQPYYYYDKSIAKRYIDPFPYFLVTHRCVVNLSEDGSSAMLLRSEDVISYYHRYFQTLTQNCHRLTQDTKDALDILESYQRCTDPDGFYVVMAQPCFGRFYTEEFLEKYLRKELPFYEEIWKAAKERFALLRRVSHFYTIFTEHGLKRFLENGMLDDYPAEVVKPFTSEDRVHLVKELAKGIESKEITGCILKDGEVAFPGYLAMCTSSEHGVGFFTTSRFSACGGDCPKTSLR